MRATQSQDTVLERAFVPDERIAMVSPAGFAGAGYFHLCQFAWPLTGFAAIYQGIAQRAFDLTVENARKRTSIALTRPMAYHPEVQHHVAEMRMALEAIDALVSRIAGDWSNGVDHGADWAVKIVAAKHLATTLAWQIVDTAFDLTGGSGIFKRNRMEQIFRDARMGRFHPANSLVAHEVVAKLSLGINPDEQPRWG
jgi:alkylation response protein AidB-like acyl-CoA dehydrogenase